MTEYPASDGRQRLAGGNVGDRRQRVEDTREKAAEILRNRYKHGARTKKTG